MLPKIIVHCNKIVNEHFDLRIERKIFREA